MGKLLLLTLNEQEEMAIDKIISAISDYIQPEAVQVAPISVLSFPGFLASNLSIVHTRTQIFEAAWNMESDSCHSGVANVIYNLWKKRTRQARTRPISKPGVFSKRV